MRISDWSSDVCSSDLAGCTVGGIATFCGVITNAGRAKIDGVELETNARLARDLAASGDRLSFSGSLGYINARYKEYITNSAAGPVDVADQRKVQNTPKWTGSATLAYETPVGNGDLSFSRTDRKSVV